MCNINKHRRKCSYGEEREAERTTWFITYQHRLQAWRGKRGRTNYMVHRITTPGAGMERKERQNELHGSSHTNTGAGIERKAEAERTTWFITYHTGCRHGEEREAERTTMGSS